MLRMATGWHHGLHHTYLIQHYNIHLYVYRVAFNLTSRLVFNLTNKGTTGCLLCLANYRSICLYRMEFNLNSRGTTDCHLCLARALFNLTSRGATDCLLCLAQNYSIYL